MFSFKKIKFFLFFFTIFLLFLTQVAKAEVVTGEHIESFDAKIKINKDGTIDVTEKILYDFGPPAGGLQKHGIYREIPYIKTNNDQKKFVLEFSDFSATDENGAPYNFVKSIVGENILLKIGDANLLITGQHTYIISYKVSGALTYFSDHDEFYWNVTGNDWNVPIASAGSAVEINTKDDKASFNVICFTGIAGSSEKNCENSADNKLLTTKTTKLLYPKEGLTIAVSFPKGLVAVLEPKEYVAFSNTLMGKLIALLIGLAVLFWYIILPIYIPVRWWMAGRDPKPVAGEVRAWFDPPKTKDGRFLTPGETGTIIDEEAGLREVSATIVDLARRGYLKIVEKKKGKFSLVKNNEADKSLTPFEKKFLHDIFAEGSEFSLENHEMYNTAETLKDSLYKQLVDDGSFPSNPKTVRTLYYVLAVIALFTGNILLAVVTFIFARAMPRKTLQGASQAAVARSLKNFLISQSRQLEFQAKNQMMFEKLLPYAVVFGVERVWTNRFKDINLKPPDWYQGYYGSNFTTAVFVASLSSSFSKMNSAMTPTRSSSGFSSGFSSGGGFSGGGGGGGGGGSW